MRMFWLMIFVLWVYVFVWFIGFNNKVLLKGCNFRNDLYFFFFKNMKLLY